MFGHCTVNSGFFQEPGRLLGSCRANTYRLWKAKREPLDQFFGNSLETRERFQHCWNFSSDFQAKLGSKASCIYLCHIFVNIYCIYFRILSSLAEISCSWRHISVKSTVDGWRKVLETKTSNKLYYKIPFGWKMIMTEI